MIELAGYLGSALVVVSMLMSSVVRLRVINTAGSGIFAVYALLIRSYPTALMNICLVGINLYNLFRLRREDQSYELVEGTREDGLLGYILEYYREDILKFFPRFPEGAPAADLKAFIVCRSGNPAGVLLGTDRGQGVFQIELDYSTPAYRDCSIGAYLYDRLPSRGVCTLLFAQDTSRAHAAYLLKMGFVRENGAYVKHLG